MQGESLGTAAPWFWLPRPNTLSFLGFLQTCQANAPLKFAKAAALAPVLRAGRDSTEKSNSLTKRCISFTGSHIFPACSLKSSRSEPSAGHTSKNLAALHGSWDKTREITVAARGNIIQHVIPRCPNRAISYSALRSKGLLRNCWRD